MKIVDKPIEWLRPYENNPRNNEQAVEAVANSIKEFGFKVPIVATIDGEIVNGHTRFKAAKSLKLKTVPVGLLIIRQESLPNGTLSYFMAN